MIRLITTPYGQLLADVKDTEGYTLIIDAKSYKPVAKVNSVERSKVLSSIRRLGTLMKLHATLDGIGIEVYNGQVLSKTEVPAPADIQNARKVKKSW